MDTATVAIDIGNTCTHFACVDRPSRSCLCAVSHTTEPGAAYLGSEVKRMVTAAGINSSLPCSISRVAGPAVDEIEQSLAGCGVVGTPRWVRYHPGLPIRTTYDSPGTLGADRLANGLFAHASFSGRNVVVIDAGTTITIDFINGEGIFAGGAILPGLEAQFSVLHSSTALLPHLASPGAAADFPAASTAACMAAGVYLGCAEALAGLVKRIEKKYGPCIVLATGGGWEAIAPLVSFTYTYNPQCTLIGTALFE
jgi:type III pantothenate kinase